MLSTIVSVVFYGFYAYDVVPYGYYALADTLSIICSSLTQAMICYLFWNIDNIQPLGVRGLPEYDEVKVEETDQFFDLQLRLWYQFMRDQDDIPSIYQSKITSTTFRGSLIKNDRQNLHEIENDKQKMRESLLGTNEEPTQSRLSVNNV